MAGTKILVVDDERECCDFFRNYFLKRGYAVDVAYDGTEGAALLNIHAYDYIFFDCNMPGLSGIELLEVIKEKNPGAKRIMISGYGLVDERFARQAGADIFLRKPVSLEMIRGIVQEAG